MDWAVETPNVLFFQSDRITAIDSSEILLVSKEIETDKPFVLEAGSAFLPSDVSGENVIPPTLGYPMSLDDLNVTDDGDSFVVVRGSSEEIAGHVERLRERVFVIGNAVEMLRHPLEFAKRTMAIKTSMSPHGLIYAPGIATPSNLSVLFYCGVDLVDSLRVIVESGTGRFHTERGSMPYEEASRRICHCPTCEEGISRDSLVDHNSHVLMRELQVCRNAMERGRLRELAERRMLTNGWCVSVMRHMDRRFHAEVEPGVPVTGGKVQALSDASLYRPDVQRFRRRLRERYSSPPGGKVLVLLPCSARKPYTLSKSHRRFRRAIRASRNRSAVHEVIVTSPLGLVPRELELFHPAQRYDIPVTGDWSGEERDVIRDGLRSFLDRNKYASKIVHLSAEREFLSDLLEDATFTSEGSPTSSSSIGALEKAVSEATRDLERMNRKERLIQDLENLAVFQFGDAGRDLVRGCTLRGRFPSVRVVREEHLATLVPARGMLSLTLEGGKVLAREKAYCVTIEDFRPEGNVFAIGVTDADQSIRTGDDVVVVHGDEVRAVGVARMSAREMVESNRGEAVRVRHRA
jgi:archaeosine synthase